MSNSFLQPHKKNNVRLSSLQYIEKIFGTLICALLHLPTALIPGTPHSDPEKVKKLLVVKFFGVGSLILAEPFFRQARRLFPNAEIHLLTLSSNFSIASRIPHIDEIRTVDLGTNIFQALRAYLTCLKHTQVARYDVLIDMEFYTRASAVVAAASMSPMRVGYHSSGVYRGSIHSHTVPFNPYWHVTRNFVNLLTPFGHSGGENGGGLVDFIPAIDFPPSAREEAGEILKTLKLTGKHPRYLVINVNAGELAFERRWFPERFAELAARLYEKYKIPALFTGSHSEVAYVQSVVDAIPDNGGVAHNVAGKLSLDGLAEICRRARLVITNDSGPLHLAAAVGANVAGFFGPETPVLYGPVGGNHLVFHEDLKCSPCINIEHGKQVKCLYEIPLCQERVSVDRAFDAITEKYDAPLR